LAPPRKRPKSAWSAPHICRFSCLHPRQPGQPQPRHACWSPASGPNQTLPCLALPCLRQLRQLRQPLGNPHASPVLHTHTALVIAHHHIIQSIAAIDLCLHSHPTLDLPPYHKPQNRRWCPFCTCQSQPQTRLYPLYWFRPSASSCPTNKRLPTPKVPRPRSLPTSHDSVLPCSRVTRPTASRLTNVSLLAAPTCLAAPSLIVL
jgi:hypothetical protein